MANRSITQLQVANYPLDGLEVFPLVQGGITKQALVLDIANVLPPKTQINIDTTTATPVYPLFADVQSGIATSLYTSSPNFLYTPSTGTLEARVVKADNGIVVNSATVFTSYTIASGSNGLSSGPMTVAGGATVTIESNASWNIVGVVSTSPWTFTYGPSKYTISHSNVPVTSIDSVGNVVALTSFAAPGTP